LAAEITVAEKEPDKAIQGLTALLNKELEETALYADLRQVYLSKQD
jgi:hypothetical protein